MYPNLVHFHAQNFIWWSVISFVFWLSICIFLKSLLEVIIHTYTGCTLSVYKQNWHWMEGRKNNLNKTIKVRSRIENDCTEVINKSGAFSSYIFNL